MEKNRVSPGLVVCVVIIGVWPSNYPHRIQDLRDNGIDDDGEIVMMMMIMMMMVTIKGVSPQFFEMSSTCSAGPKGDMRIWATDTTAVIFHKHGYQQSLGECQLWTSPPKYSPQNPFGCRELTRGVFVSVR